MRIGIISDVHSDIRSLDKALGLMGEVDLLVCAGDFVGYGKDPVEVIERLESIVDYSVMGNHDAAAISTGTEYDEWLRRMSTRAIEGIRYSREHLKDEHRAFLSKLPARQRFEVDNLEIYLVHGSPSDPLGEYVFPWKVSGKQLETWSDHENGFDEGVDVLIMGHTHEPFVKSVGSTLVINPGSIGQPRGPNMYRSYAVLETSRFSVNVIDLEEGSIREVVER